MVLLANLGLIQKQIAGGKQDISPLVKSSVEACKDLGEILHKLNAVNEYKTTQYLESVEGSDAGESRIIEI